MIIALDVDGVVADLHTEWLRRYNRDYADALTTDDILRWDMASAVKPECGDAIYSYLSAPDLYGAVMPIPGAKAGVQTLRTNGHRVVFATSCVQGMADQKWVWLQRFGFLPSGTRQARDLIIIHDKSMLNADVLVDDYPVNLSNFRGWRVLFDAPYNRDSNDIVIASRVRNWSELLDALETR